MNTISFDVELSDNIFLMVSSHVDLDIQEQENTTNYSKTASIAVQDVELLSTNPPPNSTQVVAGQLSLMDSPEP